MALELPSIRQRRIPWVTLIVAPGEEFGIVARQLIPVSFLVPDSLVESGAEEHIHHLNKGKRCPEPNIYTGSEWLLLVKL